MYFENKTCGKMKGALSSSRNLKELQQNNVVAIVSLGGFLKKKTNLKRIFKRKFWLGYNPYFENKNIEYLQLAVRDRAAESLFDAFKQSNEFIHVKRDRKSKKAVLIHCFGEKQKWFECILNVFVW